MRQLVGEEQRSGSANDDDDDDEDGMEIITTSGAVAYFPRENPGTHPTNARTSIDSHIGDGGLRMSASSSISSDRSSLVLVEYPVDEGEGTRTPHSNGDASSYRTAVSGFSSSQSSTSTRQRLLSNDVSSPTHGLVFVESDDVGEDTGSHRSSLLSVGIDDSDIGSDIYARMDSFEEKLENELRDLESLGVASGASGTKNKALEKGKDKLMTAYDSYVDEIQTNDMIDVSSFDGVYEIDDPEWNDETFPLEEGEYLDPESNDRYGPASAAFEPPCGRSRRYGRTNVNVRPWLHSKQVKRNMAMIALQVFVVIIISITVGVTARSKKSNVNVNKHDWEAEYKAELESELALLREMHAEQERDHEQELEAPVASELYAVIDEHESPPDWQGAVWMKNNGGAEEEENRSVPVSEPPVKDSEEGAVSDMEKKDTEEEANPSESIAEPPKQDGFEQELTETMELYSNAISKYQPVMYDRSKGWNGQTYKEASIFCYVQAGMAVCPYEAICPDGTRGEPLGGFRNAPYGDWAWMPILNGYDDWVQVGARETCVKYSNKYGGELPGWGTTGKGKETEGLTRNLMCCANVM